MIKKISGIWWLPNNPGNKCYGVLKIFYSKRSILELKGLFVKPENFTRFINPTFILGKGEDVGEITLFQSSEYTCGSAYSSFHVDTIFIGSYFTKEDQLKFLNVSVEYLFLTNWIDPKNTLKYNFYKGEKLRISYNPLHSEIIYLPDTRLGFKSQIKTGLSGGMHLGAGSQFNYKENTIIDIKSTTKKLHQFSDFKSIILSIQDFFSFIFQTASYPISIFGKCNINKKVLLNPSIQVYFPLRGEPEIDREYDFRSVLFYYYDVSDKIGLIIKNWFEKEEKLKPVYNLYLASLYNYDMYLEYKFLSLIQAIEAYHRIKYEGFDKYMQDDEYEIILAKLKEKSFDITENPFKNILFEKLKYGNEYSLRKRFKMLFRENFVEIFDVSKPKIESFIKKTVDTRNYLIHQDNKLKSFSFEIKEFFHANLILKTLIEVHLLNELGLKNEEIKKFYQEKIKHNNLTLKF